MNAIYIGVKSITKNIYWRERCSLFLLLLRLLSAINCSTAQRRGVASFNCNGEPNFRRPSTSFPEDNGFRLNVVGDPQAYQPLREYIVSLQSYLPLSFRGFAIRAEARDGHSAGSFTSLNTHTSRIMSSCGAMATHITDGKKTRVQIRWTSPARGCVRISATVIQKGQIWFKDNEHLSLKLCQKRNITTSSNLSACCACGSASYKMTFYGLWSPTTHPKDYPAFSTHWSNLIGASHSYNYVIWKYGGYASEGVQKVAEWGWSDDLEAEIRAQSPNDVMSVIKTKAQWPAYQPRNLREPPSDEFNVDSTRHMVSLLTMLGPSPDWNVGLSQKTMCTPACGWMGSRVYDLIPWDAGTDSGVSYTSVNSPTLPHEKIKNLTSLDHPQSPFYNPSGAPIPTVARIVIQRLNISVSHKQ